MGLHPQDFSVIPEETVRVARAAFPKGNAYMTLRDELGVIYEDRAFAPLFGSARGRPAESPGCLALVTVLLLTLLDDTQVNDEAAEKPRWVSLQDLEAQQFQTHGDIMLDLCREAATAHQVTAYGGREPCQTFQPLTNPKMTEDRVESILAEITHWAARRGNLCAVALVGSWARGAARDDSDIDLVLLTPNPLWFRENDGWLDEIDWRSIGSRIATWRDADYGLIWSRHLLLADGTEIEFGFGPLVWASVEPVDAGTFQVIRDGCRILHDPRGMLQTLIIKVERDR